MKKGSYILLIALQDDCSFQVGKIGILDFKAGYYVYAGSALNNLEKRIERHMRHDKKLFWHIDYLLSKAKIIEVFPIENPVKLECSIAIQLSKYLETIDGFGSSDCSCSAHLFFHPNKETVVSIIDAVLEFLNIRMKKQ